MLRLALLINVFASLGISLGWKGRAAIAIREIMVCVEKREVYGIENVIQTHFLFV